MAMDALLVLQASVTKTDDFDSASIDLSNGTGRKGLMAKVNFTSYSNTSGSETITPVIEHSDNDSDWTVLATGTALTTTATAQQSLQFIPVNTTKRYVRLAVEFSATTGTPTCTYNAKLGFDAKP